MNEIGLMMPALIFLAAVISVGFFVSIFDFFMDLFGHEDK
jgi:hypothetical protein